MGDMQKTERLIAISLLLQTRGKMTAHHLANILGVSIRTIYRDIMALSLAHVPVSMDYGPGGGYYLPEDYHFDSAIFTPDEAVSLVLSADMAGNASLFAGDNGLQSALLKLEATLPEEYRLNVRAARGHILFDTTAWNGHDTPPVHLETIRDAVLRAHQLDILAPCISHPGWRRPRWHRVEPYGLVFRGLPRRHARIGIWYLIAYCRDSCDFDIFRVSHIEKLKIRKEEVMPQPNFDLRACWQKARTYIEEMEPTIVLKLRVSPAIRHSLRSNYTLVREEADGSIVVRLELESVESAISYTLSLGPEATVICPMKVRRAVAEKARKIAESYA